MIQYTKNKKSREHFYNSVLINKIFLKKICIYSSLMYLIEILLPIPMLPLYFKYNVINDKSINNSKKLNKYEFLIKF
jgi:hypothetical protein